MRLRYSVFFTPRAAREIRQASRWWDENRPAAPEAFREALGLALELIANQPEVGAVAANTKLRRVRRILLSQVDYFLYYQVGRTSSTIAVVAVWHTRRYPNPGL